jgi:hypothetical protein
MWYILQTGFTANIYLHLLYEKLRTINTVSIRAVKEALGHRKGGACPWGGGGSDPGI